MMAQKKFIIEWEQYVPEDVTKVAKLRLDNGGRGFCYSDALAKSEELYRRPTVIRVEWKPIEEEDGKIDWRLNP